RTKDEAPRRWHGQSVIRRVEVEYSDGRVALEALRFVVVHSSQLAPQPTQTDASGQAKEAEAGADPVTRGQGRWFACLPDPGAARGGVWGPNTGPGRPPPPPLALPRSPLSQGGSPPPHASCPSGTASEDGATTAGIGLSPRRGGGEPA